MTPIRWTLLLALLCAARPGAAQTVPFGKNKIQYRNFQWHVLQGEHVDVYYYPEEDRIARMALAHAEESFRMLERRFRHHPFARIPLIVYASHQHFEQTNVYPGLIPEGVLGFTEYLKRRVALPFRGDYAQFRQTLRHELVHAFQISKIEEVRGLHPGRERFTPQEVHWWTEGLAEYWSGEQSAEDVMFNRDLLLHGAIPPLRELTGHRGYLAYPLGAALHAYLAARFGEEYIVEVYENFWRYDSFHAALEGVLGIDLDRLDEEWRLALQRRFFPDLAARSPPAVAAVPVLYRAGGNFQPSVWLDPADSTVHVFFLSLRDGHAGVYRTRLADGEDGVRRVIEGEKSAQFESLHPYESGIDVHRSGILAFVSKYLERDALFLWDVRGGRVVGRYQWPDLVAIQSPSWHPDGRRIAFEGLSTAGYSDLYVLDLTTHQRTRLTADPFKDEDPDWAPDGRTLVFASDRTGYGPGGHTNLFLIDAGTAAIRALTDGPWSDRDPRWSHDGTRIAFRSDRGGTPDLYIVTSDGAGGRVTALAGGALDPTWLPGDDGLLFVGFAAGTYRIYRISPGDAAPAGPRIASRGPTEAAAHDRAAPAARPTEDRAAADGWAWPEPRDVLLDSVPTRRYDTWRRISFDVAGGDAFVAPGLGAAQGAQFLASDMLGDHLLFGGLSAVQARTIGELLDNFSGSLVYLDLSHRLNFGVGLFRHKGRYEDVTADAFDEARYGAYFVAGYPFSRYRRLELHLGLERSDRLDVGNTLGSALGGASDEDGRDISRSGLLASNFLSYVKDNTLWIPTGPIDGERFDLTAGFLSCFGCRAPVEGIDSAVDRSAAVERYVISADYRRYFRTTRRSAYAVRALAFWSDGIIPGRAPLGGPHRVRGYPRHSLAASRAALLNQEWRFPLLPGFGLDSPLGGYPWPGIEGALFLDAAAARPQRSAPTGIFGSFGLGLRTAIAPPIVLRADLGRRYHHGDVPEAFLGAVRADDPWFVDLFFGYDY